MQLDVNQNISDLYGIKSSLLIVWGEQLFYCRNALCLIIERVTCIRESGVLRLYFKVPLVFRTPTAYLSFIHTHTMPVKDPSSFANTSDIVTTHLHLNWNISFQERKIAGNVLLDLVALKDNVDKVVLDTSYLDIRAVYVNDTEAKVNGH